MVRLGLGAAVEDGHACRDRAFGFDVGFVLFHFKEFGVQELNQRDDVVDVGVF